ncbi:MAG: 4-hydroxy-tetrahydrodipicolinate reductase [Myxococcales bacterium]|nr:4-hydroxy-tetrahydrodipicolinate reductase [Myxococcales bacterium]
MSIGVGIVGAAGRMGQELVREVYGHEALRLAAACESPGSPAVGRDAHAVAGIGEPAGVIIGDDLEAMVRACDVVIDFTAPAVSVKVAALCAEHGKALVVGTTGLDAAQGEKLAAAAERVPVVWAPNMSVGVNVLIGLVEQAARTLGASYDIELVETHHRHKKDAPSGTALRLARAAAEGTRELGTFEERANYGREGLDPRRPHQIGIHAVRGGDVVGDHTISFCTDGERVELSHRASSRRTFTQGAVRAASWVHGRDAGLYDMRDVLGL